MLFSSVPFLYYFLPAVLILYFLAPRVLKNAVLLLASLVFYGWGEPKLLALMIFTILLFYGCGLAIGRCTQKKWKKFWMVVSVTISVALLGLFKYADFFIDSFNAVTGLSVPLLRLALPVGISFYTFQCLSYTIDVYRGNVESQKNPVSFGAYVALFPQLIAGPIVRYVDVVRELNSRTHSWDNVALGLRRFIVGLSKKIILADNFALLMKMFRESNEKSVVFYWMYAIAFALNIYFDFSGYSDMAIGLGRVFGFKFIENFNYPYMSKSVSEFWRRWHMSLGSWFRDYIYIPLGGNRVSKWRWVLNVLAVWMLTGLWHGAAWNFVLWGLMFAVLLLVEKWIPAIGKLPVAVRHVWTLLWVVLSFVLFNADSLSQAIGDIGGMFGFAGVPMITMETLYYLGSYGILFVLGFIGATPVVRDTAKRLYQYKAVAILEPIVLIALLLICTGYLVDGSFSPFLYFRF
jgi:alginate O-acetyltransferase complex protein AlgI